MCLSVRQSQIDKDFVCVIESVYPWSVLFVVVCGLSRQMQK